jgi:protein ImuB
MSRVAALELPELALQLARRDRSLDVQVPLGVATSVAGRQLVVQLNEAARLAGGREQRSVSQLRAQVPGLVVVEADWPGTWRLLTGLAEALESLSPAVELSPPHILLLDASAARLVTAGPEGERRWAAEVLSMARAFGVEGRLVLADTPLGALLTAGLVKPGRVRRVPPGGTLAALSELPLAEVDGRRREAALMRPRMEPGAPGTLPWPECPTELPVELFTALDELGLKRLGDVLTLPWGCLLERFGAAADALLLLARGGLSRPLTAHRRPAELTERLDLEAPLDQAAGLVFAARAPMERLCHRLAGGGVGATRLTLRLSADWPETTPLADRGGAMRRRVELPLALSAPSHRPEGWLALVRDRLESWHEPSPIHGFELVVTETGQVQAQLRLGERPRAAEAMESVLDRLRGRLGRESLGRLRAPTALLPESAGQLHDLPSNAERLSSSGWAMRAPSNADDLVVQTGTVADTEASEPLPEAPTELPLRQWSPEPIRPECDHRGSPRAFLWRGRRHRVVARTPPRRLMTHWWSHRIVREYQTVLVADGARLWLFRDGAGDWWVQGVHD